MALAIDKNKLTEERLKNIKSMEKQNIKQQFESTKLAKEEYKKQKLEMERESRLRGEEEFKNLTQKQIKDKLHKVQEMNQFLMKQMETKNIKDKLDNQWRKEGEKPFVNKTKDKSIKDNINCQVCHKDIK